MSRSLWDQAASAARAPSRTPAPPCGSAPRTPSRDAGSAAPRARRLGGRAVTGALPGAKSSGAGDADKAFEELYDRLKRELMNEQEQLGQLFHEP